MARNADGGFTVRKGSTEHLEIIVDACDTHHLWLLEATARTVASSVFRVRPASEVQMHVQQDL